MIDLMSRSPFWRMDISNVLLGQRADPFHQRLRIDRRAQLLICIIEARIPQPRASRALHTVRGPIADRHRADAASDWAYSLDCQRSWSIRALAFELRFVTHASIAVEQRISRPRRILLPSIFYVLNRWVRRRVR